MALFFMGEGDSNFHRDWMFRALSVTFCPVLDRFILTFDTFRKIILNVTTLHDLEGERAVT